MKFSLNRPSLIALSLVITTSLCAGVALADGDKEGKRGSRHDGMFERMDANKDGKITKAEARQTSEERFKKVDTNKDNVITREEAKAAHEKMREERAKKHGDKEHSKHRKGHRHGPGHLFAKLDVNKDGKITKAEAQKVAD
jgi:Ca2+-binding EF-hand superfamily protein